MIEFSRSPTGDDTAIIMLMERLELPGCVLVPVGEPPAGAHDAERARVRACGHSRVLGLGRIGERRALHGQSCRDTHDLRGVVVCLRLVGSEPEVVDGLSGF